MEVVTRPRWTETYVKWSPLGTYMTTLHAKGVVIWGGPDFNRLMNYSHPNVQVKTQELELIANRETVRVPLFGSSSTSAPARSTS